MRRVAVIAHVRGNKPALDAVLERLDALAPPPDQVIVTGDCAGDGPHPSRVEKLLNKRGLLPPPVIDAQAALARYLINPANAGTSPNGDPRASFALLSVEGDELTGVEHVHVPYDLKKTTRAVLKKIDRRQIDPKRGLDYLRGLLGDPRLVDEDRPLAPEMKGNELTIAMLGARTFRVYGAGSLDWPEDQKKHVHDLRVANRRLREAMSIVSPVLRKKSFDRANRRARRFGRVLGGRRVFDVFLEEVKKIAEAEHLDLSAFLAFLEARRDQATIEIHVELPKRKLIRHGLKVLEMAMWPIDQEQTLAAIAPAHIEESALEVEARAQPIEDENAHDQHHELRIKLKHLRYSAEILRSAWPQLIDPEKTVVPVKTMQDALGELNDARELVALADSQGDGAALRRFSELMSQARAERYKHAVSEVKSKLAVVLEEMRGIARAIRG